jgi:hypothetical protein
MRKEKRQPLLSSGSVGVAIDDGLMSGDEGVEVVAEGGRQVPYEGSHSGPQWSESEPQKPNILESRELDMCCFFLVSEMVWSNLQQSP